MVSETDDTEKGDWEAYHWGAIYLYKSQNSLTKPLDMVAIKIETEFSLGNVLKKFRRVGGADPPNTFSFKFYSNIFNTSMF